MITPNERGLILIAFVSNTCKIAILHSKEVYFRTETYQCGHGKICMAFLCGRHHLPLITIF